MARASDGPVRPHLPDGLPNLVGDSLGLRDCARALEASRRRDEGRAQLAARTPVDSAAFEVPPEPSETTLRLRGEWQAGLCRVVADAVRLTSTLSVLSPQLRALGPVLGAAAGVASGAFGALLAWRQTSRVEDARARSGALARRAVADLADQLAEIRGSAHHAGAHFAEVFLALELDRLDALEAHQAAELGKYAFGVAGAVMSSLSAAAPVLALRAGAVDTLGMVFGLTSLSFALASGRTFAAQQKSLEPRLEEVLAVLEETVQRAPREALEVARPVAGYVGVRAEQLLDPALARLALTLHLEPFASPSQS